MWRMTGQAVGERLLNTAGQVVHGGTTPSLGALAEGLRSAAQALTWRRAGTVLVLCLIFSTQVLAQPGLFEHWSLDRIVEGWAYYAIEISLPGFAMLAGVVLAEGVTEAGGPRRAIALSVALPASAALGYAIAVTNLYSPGFSILSWQYVGDTLRMTALGSAVVVIERLRRGSDRAAAATHESTVARESLAKQTLEARLQLMEAQIEPHFLFNSLATVQCLYETDPESGQRLLDNLKTYLDAAIPQMRGTRATLGREAALAKAYLEVLRTRMGERLSFTVDIPADLRDHLFPPMMVITLVENAIKHGIHRAPTGGFVGVRAHLDGRRLTVEVVDTGAGFRSTSGKGIGLANIRARLGALFGDQGELSLSPNAPSGVVATIVVPFRERAPT